jgi:hypothetical protein
MRLGGCAGIGVGAFILPFAASNDYIGGLFAREVLQGASGQAWLQRIAAHPELSLIAIVLPIIGFPLMLVVGLVLHRLVGGRHWASTLAMAGYLVGAPLAVMSFASAASLVSGVLDSGWANTPGLTEDALLPVTMELHRMMVVNLAVGPLFLILIANPAMALAAWRTQILPPWLCAWAIGNGVFMLIGVASVWWPALAFGQLAGPLTMLWFVTTGIVLLVKSRTSSLND